MHLILVLAISSLLGATLPAAAQQDKKPTPPKVEKFSVGDRAPAIGPHKWFNSEPIEKFKPGTIYVVEFWATWCGPCRKMMPHLSELNTKYQKAGEKVVFIGVNAEAKRDKVEAFVKKKTASGTINYPVLLSTGEMYYAWMNGAGRKGLPTTFVVDQKGRIAHIGHPADLERILPRVLSGKFDPKRQAERDKTTRSIHKRMYRLSKNRDKATPEQVDALLSDIDKALQKDPGLAADIAHFRVILLVRFQNNPTEAAKFTKKLATGPLKNDTTALVRFADLLLHSSQAKKHSGLALNFAKRARKLSPENSYAIVLESLALAHTKSKQTALTHLDQNRPTAPDKKTTALFDKIKQEINAL